MLSPCSSSAAWRRAGRRAGGDRNQGSTQGAVGSDRLRCWQTGAWLRAPWHRSVPLKGPIPINYDFPTNPARFPTFFKAEVLGDRSPLPPKPRRAALARIQGRCYQRGATCGVGAAPLAAPCTAHPLTHLSIYPCGAGNGT